MHLKALKFMNLSKSNGLPGMCAAYLGMRGRLTKKVMGPELVQEATGEVVGIRFHPRERFGFAQNTGGGCEKPSPDHPCWQRGFVVCEYLPVHLEIRWDGCTVGPWRALQATAPMPHGGRECRGRRGGALSQRIRRLLSGAWTDSDLVL